MALRQKSTGKWVNSFQNLFPRIQEVEKIEDALVDDDFLEECFYDTSDLELIEVSVVPLPQKGVEEKFDFEKEYVGKSIRKHNFDADDDSLYVCHGEHERSAQCEFVRLSPHEALKLINELRAECLANQSQPSLPKGKTAEEILTRHMDATDNLNIPLIVSAMEEYANQVKPTEEKQNGNS